MHVIRCSVKYVKDEAPAPIISNNAKHHSPIKRENFGLLPVTIQEIRKGAGKPEETAP